MIADGLRVSPLAAQLRMHKHLWGEHPERVRGVSPHADSQDIWVRYRRPGDLISSKNFAEPHFSVWYPAADALPAAKHLALEMMRAVGGTHLGGVLLTKIPPGGKILPHDDRGTWHAETMDFKVWLLIDANEGCVNTCEDEAVNMRAGEAWTFSNLKTHSVENNGDTDRICLIICMRTT